MTLSEPGDDLPTERYLQPRAQRHSLDPEQPIFELTRAGPLEDLAEELAAVTRTGLRVEAVEGAA